MQTLIIGNMRGHANKTAIYLHSNGAKVATSENIGTAIHHLRKSSKYDLALIDMDLDIRRFISQLQVEELSLPIVACGAIGNSAKKAKELGAQEFLSLPTSEQEIANILKNPQPKKTPINNMIIESPAMVKLLEEALKIAKSRAHVFISGESGSGKELLANYIHQNSNRANNEFVAINCAAIVESLLESELFGHEKGAFTGALTTRKGKFELADNGTLLLDEISEMNYHMQAKLLRAIQEQRIDKVGSNIPIDINLRIIATSNRDILQEVKAGRFREDLYYRLNVMPLTIQPLRKRKEDIAKLANHFICRFSNEYGFAYEPLPSKILTKLQNYDYPGNVRELENIIHRAIILTDGKAIKEEAIILHT